jgi:hypothetical protein
MKNKSIIFLSIFTIINICFGGIIYSQEDGVSDLLLISIDVPLTVSSQQQIEVSETVNRQGNGDVIPKLGGTGATIFYN